MLALNVCSHTLDVAHNHNPVSVDSRIALAVQFTSRAVSLLSASQSGLVPAHAQHHISNQSVRTHNSMVHFVTSEAINNTHDVTDTSPHTVTCKHILGLEAHCDTACVHDAM